MREAAAQQSLLSAQQGSSAAIARVSGGEGLSATVGAGARWVYDAALIQPLRRLYFAGPGHLFWGGRAPEDVCAALTGVAATHWLGARDGACETLLENAFEGFLVAVETGLYFLMLYRVACAAVDALVACRCRCRGSGRDARKNERAGGARELDECVK